MSKLVKYSVIAIVVLSFAFFGIYGVITSQKGFVAKVDGEKITNIKFQNYLSERKQGILSNNPSKETINLVSSKQFERIMLNEMINSIVIHKFLQSNGINITEKVAAAYVRTLQSFKKDNEFDSNYFKTYLEYTGTKEKDLLKSYIPKIEETIFTSLTNGVKFSMENVARQYVKSQKVQRNFDILLLQNNKKFEYTEDELAQYYETIKQQFVQPAKHIVIISNLDDYINQNIRIFHSTPQNIAQYYNEEYMGKNIKLQYAIFQDKQTAQTVQAIVAKQGISLQNVVDTILTKTPNSVAKHGTEISQNIENAEILTAIKNLSKNSVTPIIETQKGYYIAQILEIKENTFTQTGEKQNIDKQILQKRKCNNIEIFTDRISTDLQSGASFEAASLKYGFPISTSVIIDSQTQKVTNAHTNLPQKINKSLLNHILQNDDTTYGHVIKLEKTNCSFAIYKQTKIEPQRILSLSEVRGKVLEMFEKHKAMQNLEKEAKTIESNIKSLKNTLSEYSKAGTFVNVNISLATNNISPELFTKPLGTTFAVTGKNGNVYVVTINSQTQFTGAISSSEISQAKDQIENIYYNTYLQEWLNLMYLQHSVKIYI